MDVETAIEIHRHGVQASIPDKRITTTLVPELEFKQWRRNGKILKHPVGVCFSPCHSKLFVSDRHQHAVYMLDMHCPVNVTLIAGGNGPGHANGQGKGVKMRDPADPDIDGKVIYVCDQGNGRIRVIDCTSLFCHSSRLNLGSDTSENGDEDRDGDEECATRRIRQVTVGDLTLTSDSEECNLKSPFGICRSHKDPFTLYVSDIREQMLFSIANINSDANGNYSGHLNAILSFGRTSILTSIAVTRDDDHILVEDCKESAPCVYVCYLPVLFCTQNKTITRTVSGVVAPTGIAVTEEGTVFISSSKINTLLTMTEVDLITSDNTPTAISSSTDAGYCDGLDAQWNAPSGLCSYRNTILACDTGNKAVRMVTSAVGLVHLQQNMSMYANVFRLDKKCEKENFPERFDEHKRQIEHLVAFLLDHEEKAKESTNGPDMTIPRCTRQSFQIALDSLTSLANTLTEIGEERVLEEIRFASLTTLSVECFFKAMRADHDMPTMGRTRFISGDPPNLMQRPSKKTQTKEGTGDETCRRAETMREFTREYGRRVRQANVRAKRKELTGTLPYSLSMLPDRIETGSDDVLDFTREASPYWLAVMMEDVLVIAATGRFQKNSVTFRWLDQTDDHLKYTFHEVCNGNSPRCLLAKVESLTIDDQIVTITPEEDIKLSRIANGDDQTVETRENENEERKWLTNGESSSTPTEAKEESFPARVEGVSLSGRKTTRFILR
ncbi:predicted protein [Nematostella vectensis]|uniref:Uncharacterized protein n=1 Tax=Nematostella vectensis TaxID=45351 RepID=A7SSS4_NEMVE|nr:predicted protein [Nematostella vectensis]|eukprot:XP_001625337.1 predicted protein [Nematostella vectensis]